MISDKKILLGVTGSIAAYKVIDWLRKLREEDAEVTVVMTAAAKQFITPLTFAALSGNQVHDDMFDTCGAEKIPHINLARNSDLVLIAPATAQTISRLANGLADDLLSAITLATDAGVMICPAMNCKMYMHQATQENITKLRGYGYHVIEPECGRMACGEEGAGRLPDWETIHEAIHTFFSPQDMTGEHVLVTAGPTIEPLDPVRFLSNRSSGKMGYALARTARRRGAQVTLVSGPVTLPAPAGIELIQVKTTAEMHEAVLKSSKKASIIIKAAAVTDFRPETISDQKIKKTDEGLELVLEKSPDILGELGKLKKRRKNFPFLAGFAAESRNLKKEGWRKLQEKNLDLIVINDITEIDAGFEVDTNRITMLDKDGVEEKLPLMSKEKAADMIWNRILQILQT